MNSRNRIDKILLDRKLALSRSAAQKLISEGAAFVKEAGEWKAVTKASEKFDDHCELKVEPIEELKYASRAGLKLEAAICSGQVKPDTFL